MEGPKGAFAPVPTPVDRAGSFDEAALAAHLAWLRDEGLDGALILGTNGEYPSFSLEERRTIARAAARHGAGLSLLLGVGSCALPEVLAMLDAAAEGGYAAVLCPPPFYFPSPPTAGVVQFPGRVLDAAEVPTLLYHVPQLTGVPISDAVLDGLAGHPRLVGVKDSTGQLDELTRLVSRFPDGGYFVGNDRLVSACRRAGGSGSISAVASVAPRLITSVQNHGERQPALDALRELLEEEGLGASVKALLRQRGFGHYGSRPPLRALSPAASEALAQRFAQLVTAST